MTININTSHPIMWTMGTDTVLLILSCHKELGLDTLAMIINFAVF
jgi:hypothetical protein